MLMLMLMLVLVLCLTIALLVRQTNALSVRQINVPRPTRHVSQLQKQMEHALGPKVRHVPAPVPAQKYMEKSKSKQKPR
jgi:cell division protein FtsL